MQTAYRPYAVGGLDSTEELPHADVRHRPRVRNVHL
jgi:hypothetical protein